MFLTIFADEGESSDELIRTRVPKRQRRRIDSEYSDTQPLRLKRNNTGFGAANRGSYGSDHLFSSYDEDTHQMTIISSRGRRRKRSYLVRDLLR